MGHPATREGGLSPTPESVGAHTMRRWLGAGHLHGGSGGSRVGPGWLAGRPWRLAGGPWQPRTARKQATAAQMAPTGRSWQLRRRSRAAVGRSCTFFLQTAISKRRDHADLPGKPGPGNRMNVQRRPSCTFILSPDAPQGRETVGTTPPTPPGPQNECATRPRPPHHQPAPRPPARQRPPPPPHDLHATSTRKQTPAPRPLQDDTTSRYPDKEANPDGPPPTPPPQPGPLP